MILLVRFERKKHFVLRKAYKGTYLAVDEITGFPDHAKTDKTFCPFLGVVLRKNTSQHIKYSSLLNCYTISHLN